jgi:hypothetical protein
MHEPPPAIPSRTRCAVAATPVRLPALSSAAALQNSSTAVFFPSSTSLYSEIGTSARLTLAEPGRQLATVLRCCSDRPSPGANCLLPLLSHYGAPHSSTASKTLAATRPIRSLLAAMGFLAHTDLHDACRMAAWLQPGRPRPAAKAPPCSNLNAGETALLMQLWCRLSIDSSAKL